VEFWLGAWRQPAYKVFRQVDSKLQCFPVRKEIFATNWRWLFAGLIRSERVGKALGPTWKPPARAANVPDPAIKPLLRPVLSSWPRLALAAWVVLTLSWCALALGYWLFMKQIRGFTTAEYLNLVLPHRWPRHRAALGDFHIEQAVQLATRGDYHRALGLARAGLTHSPANAGGRLLLADLCLAARRSDLAVQTLADGLPRLAGEAAYLRRTFSLLLEQQQDSRLLELAAPLLAPGGGTLPTQPLIALFAARAEYQLGHPTRAAELIQRHDLAAHPEAAALLARIEWDRGYRDLAVLRLRDHCRPGADDGPAHAQLAAFLRESGRWDELQTFAVQRLAGAPLAFGPRLELLHLFHHRGDPARVDRDAAAGLAHFPRDPAALLMLADFAASTGRPALAGEVLAHALRARLPEGSFRLMLAEAHLAAREYEPALAVLGELVRTDAAAGPPSVLSGLQTIGCFGLNRTDDAQRHLAALLSHPHPRPDNLLAIARRLRAIGRPGPAREVLARIAGNEPPHQPALDALVRLDLETGAIPDLPGHLESLLKTRHPARETLLLASAELGSDRHLFLPGQPAVLAALQAALAVNPGP